VQVAEGTATVQVCSPIRWHNLHGTVPRAGGNSAREKAATVACIADIHGVMPALEAVLCRPEVANADFIVVCGDIAAGPQPTQVLDRLSTEQRSTGTRHWTWAGRSPARTGAVV
jgi:hypothetical protein